ncbi:MAG: 4-alpha-glucanotransferase, partial [Rhodothermales bacterium]|nr:4-alpha-glucanotransferase [Rhodothermales bacterium]
AWVEWPAALRDRHADALAAATDQLQHQVRLERFAQFLFFTQWNNLRQYCHDRGVRIIGDLPIYVAHDSADVWSNPDLFFLDHTGNPTVVAGVPPDYFSETGQLWGNPIYRWDRMLANDYAWWTERIRGILSMVDIVRLDHFRAFDAYWSVPAHEETAVNGEWVPGPGQTFFDVVRDKLGSIPLIAEDLGLITDGVIKLIEDNGYPGMAILEFAFDSGPSNKFLPHNYVRNLVAYSGTHDNDTVVGWLSDNRSTQDEATTSRLRDYARRYLGEPEDSLLHKAFIRALYASIANQVIIPIQDLLGLGGETRMNVPGTVEGNWEWRMHETALSADVAAELAELVDTFGR